MKRILLGTVTAAALVMGAQAALAADVTVPIFFNYWTGAYAGLHGGWGWTSTQGLNASGDFGGGQVGYNYQIGNFVLGLEGDGAFANISQTVTNVFFGHSGRSRLPRRWLGIVARPIWNRIPEHIVLRNGWWRVGHDRISTTQYPGNTHWA